MATASEVANALFAAYNDGDLDAVARLYGPDAVHTEASNGRSKVGREAICNGQKFFISAFPDAAWSVLDVIVDGGRAVVEYQLTGSLAVDLGPYQGNGQKISLSGVMLIRLEGEQIISTTDYWDSGTFAKQLTEEVPATVAARRHAHQPSDSLV